MSNVVDYVQKARDALMRAQSTEDRSAKLAWLDIASRYQLLASQHEIAGVAFRGQRKGGTPA